MRQGSSFRAPNSLPFKVVILYQYRGSRPMEMAGVLAGVIAKRFVGFGSTGSVAGAQMLPTMVLQRAICVVLTKVLAKRMVVYMVPRREIAVLLLVLRPIRLEIVETPLRGPVSVTQHPVTSQPVVAIRWWIRHPAVALPSNEKRRSPGDETRSSRVGGKM